MEIFQILFFITPWINLNGYKKKCCLQCSRMRWVFNSKQTQLMKWKHHYVSAEIFHQRVNSEREKDNDKMRMSIISQASYKSKFLCSTSVFEILRFKIAKINSRVFISTHKKKIRMKDFIFHFTWAAENLLITSLHSSSPSLYVSLSLALSLSFILIDIHAILMS